MSEHPLPKLWQPSSKFLSTANLEKIIKENQKNIAILAGPGAGKTEILAQRANFLLQTGASNLHKKS